MNDPPVAKGWFNRTVIGAGLASMLADICYEMAAAALPSFLRSLTPLFAPFVGLIEGSADAISNFAKLTVGWYSDSLTRRKPLVVFGYALTGLSQALFAFALGWPLVFVGKSLGWLGKGIRGPLRNAILADAVAAEDRGKAFGFHRAGDTIGAVVGPLIAYAILREMPESASAFRLIFLLTLIPGIGSALTFAFLIKERPHPANPRQFMGSLRALPKDFRRWLVGVGVFGLGDCSDKLLILAATLTLEPTLGPKGAAEFGILLYAWRNLTQALIAYPVGVLSDRIGPRRILIAGYLLGSLVMAGFATMGEFEWQSRLVFLVLFTLAGIYLAVEEALEGVMTADLVPDRSLRGTAYGVMGTVNGVGDLFSSLIVGWLMYVTNIRTAFLTAAGIMLIGTIIMAAIRRSPNNNAPNIPENV
jgi:MFS family permease